MPVFLARHVNPYVLRLLKNKSVQVYKSKAAKWMSVERVLLVEVMWLRVVTRDEAVWYNEEKQSKLWPNYCPGKYTPRTV